MQVLNTAKANETTVVYNSREFCDTILQGFVISNHVALSTEWMGPSKHSLLPKTKHGLIPHRASAEDFGYDPAIYVERLAA
jgi:hypothetical protein